MPPKLIMKQSAPSLSVLRTILNVLSLYLKRIFLDQVLTCDVFNLLCNIFSVFIFIYFLALSTFSLNYYARFSLCFLLSFTVLSRAFDPICMKMRVINFIIIIIILLLILLDKNKGCDNLIYLQHGILFFFKGP